MRAKYILKGLVAKRVERDWYDVYRINQRTGRAANQVGIIYRDKGLWHPVDGEGRDFPSQRNFMHAFRVLRSVVRI